MFIVISDNCESYSDHSHMTNLVCEKEEDAKKAVELLRGWMSRASVIISDEWHRFENRPGKENETNTNYDDGSTYCLTWEKNAEREPMPIEVHMGCFPYCVSAPLSERDLKDAIDYMEVPKWARNMP